jgi:bifunctional DNA-binding transcriptional regulator/antitoxin component of YhaV-PrlF toxin-antitoxin module
MSGRYAETGKIGKKGVFTIPALLRRRFGFTDRSLVVAEELDEGVLLRPAAATPVEIYTDQRIAEFLLSSASDPYDYEAARAEVRTLGIDPDSVPRRKPAA